MSDVLSDPKSTAVLFVECQNGLLGDESIMKTIAIAAAPQKEALGRLARGARSAGARVCHLTYIPMANNRSTNRKPPLFARLNDAMDPWTADSTAVLPIPEIGLEPGDLLLPRHTGFSPVNGQETFKLLRNIGVTTIVLAGISANVALPVAGVEATDENFDVIFPSDAIAGSPPEYREMVIKHTLAFIGTITTVDQLLTAWGVGDIK
ncbi:MAG: isochorismatase family protein [Acidimicrobiia bacterium]|nr:isochorismatase family protein [Acidimicrobiia bacterium]